MTHDLTGLRILRRTEMMTFEERSELEDLIASLAYDMHSGRCLDSFAGTVKWEDEHDNEQITRCRIERIRWNIEDDMPSRLWGYDLDTGAPFEVPVSSIFSLSLNSFGCGGTTND